MGAAAQQSQSCGLRAQRLRLQLSLQTNHRSPVRLSLLYLTIAASSMSWQFGISGRPSRPQHGLYNPSLSVLRSHAQLPSAGGGWLGLMMLVASGVAVLIFLSYIGGGTARRVRRLACVSYGAADEFEEHKLLPQWTSVDAASLQPADGPSTPPPPSPPPPPSRPIPAAVMPRLHHLVERVHAYCGGYGSMLGRPFMCAERFLRRLDACGGHAGCSEQHARGPPPMDVHDGLAELTELLHVVEQNPPRHMDLWTSLIDKVTAALALLLSPPPQPPAPPPPTPPDSMDHPCMPSAPPSPAGGTGGSAGSCIGEAERQAHSMPYVDYCPNCLPTDQPPPSPPPGPPGAPGDNGDDLNLAPLTGVVPEEKVCFTQTHQRGIPLQHPRTEVRLSPNLQGSGGGGWVGSPPPQWPAMQQAMQQEPRRNMNMGGAVQPNSGWSHQASRLPNAHSCAGHASTYVGHAGVPVACESVPAARQSPVACGERYGSPVHAVMDGLDLGFQPPTVYQAALPSQQQRPQCRSQPQQQQQQVVCISTLAHQSASHCCI